MRICLMTTKTNKRSDIMQLAGAWSDMTDEEAEEMKKQIREVSRSSTRALFKRFGNKSR